MTFRFEKDTDMRTRASRPRLRLGAIYPNDAWVDVEAQALVEDFKSFLPQEVDLISAATYIPAADATLPNAINWANSTDIDEAARRLSRYQPDCFAYYCTTMSFVRGPGMDLDISRRITAAGGKPATTTSTAMIAAMQALGVTRVTVASPYLPDVEGEFVNFLEAHGIKVLRSKSLHLRDGHSIVPSDEMAELVESCDMPESEAIFVGCTGQRLARHIESLEAKLGKPVLTANQVTSWHALKLMGVLSPIPHRGSLFTKE
jgi:maleate isomerase